jgi:hypothetical protein
MKNKYALVYRKLKYLKEPFHKKELFFYFWHRAGESSVQQAECDLKKTARCTVHAVHRANTI